MNRSTKVATFSSLKPRLAVFRDSALSELASGDDKIHVNVSLDSAPIGHRSSNMGHRKMKSAAAYDVGTFKYSEDAASTVSPSVACWT